MPINPNLLKELTLHNESSSIPNSRDVLANVAIKAMNAFESDTSGFRCIENQETRAAFEHAFMRTQDIYGIAPPSLKDFDAASLAQFESLGGAYESLADPVIILTPHLAKQATIDLFAAKMHDDTIPNNPMKNGPDASGLNGEMIFSDSLWYEIDVPQSECPLAMTENGILWSLVVAYGGQIPEHPGASYDQLKDAQIPLLTISQYLGLQLRCMHEGRHPVDAVYKSWLQGRPNTLWAPIAKWDSFNRQISVSIMERDTKDYAVGTRRARW